MDLLQPGSCDAAFEDPVILLCIDIEWLLIEGVFLGNLVDGPSGEVWGSGGRLGVVEVMVGWRLVLLLLLVLWVVVVGRGRGGLFAG